MKSFRFCIIWVGLVLVCSFSESKKTPRFVPKMSSKAATLLKDGPIRGFTLGLQSKSHTYNYKMLLKEIKATGAPWVSITFTLYQETNDASQINIPPAGDPFWCQIEKTSKQAKALGFKVLLFPIVLIKKPVFKQWRGTLRPSNYDDWYKSYESLDDPNS